MQPGLQHSRAVEVQVHPPVPRRSQGKRSCSAFAPTGLPSRAISAACARGDPSARGLEQVPGELLPDGAAVAYFNAHAFFEDVVSG